MLEETLRSIIFSALVGILTTATAYFNGFFHSTPYPRPQIRLTHLFVVFAVYLGFVLLFPILLQSVFRHASDTFLIFMQIGFIFLLLIMTLLYARSEKCGSMASAIKNPASLSSRWADFGLGFLVWFVAYPWVIAINQTCDYFLERLTNFQSFEQTAVQFLKDNMVSVHQLILALILVLIIDPIIEELLFRGVLQQYLKKFCSTKTAIVLTAFLFAIFHYTDGQGISNLSVIPSLFVFSCFLGYTYERQGSLFASIGLHIAFNLAGVVQILFFS